MFGGRETGCVGAGNISFPAASRKRTFPPWRHQNRQSVTCITNRRSAFCDYSPEAATLRSRSRWEDCHGCGAWWGAWPRRRHPGCHCAGFVCFGCGARARRHHSARRHDARHSGEPGSVCRAARCRMGDGLRARILYPLLFVERRRGRPLAGGVSSGRQARPLQSQDDDVVATRHVRLQYRKLHEDGGQALDEIACDRDLSRADGHRRFIRLSWRPQDQSRACCHECGARRHQAALSVHGVQPGRAVRRLHADWRPACPAPGHRLRRSRLRPPRPG
jgi:hypothetical protein